MKQFILRQRFEVDGLEPGMPPVTEKHYVCDPRCPDRTPAISNDFLMHRFNTPTHFSQDKICFDQIPKRINERPTPGIAPDLHTGWGIYLEEGLDSHRICLLLLTGFVSSGMFGLI